MSEGIPRVVWYVLLIVMLETMALSCFKRSLDNSKFFLVGVLFYALVGLLLCKTFKYKGLGQVNALWSAMSVVATTVVGVMLFKETLHLHDYIAIAMIGSGVMIMKLTD